MYYKTNIQLLAKKNERLAKIVDMTPLTGRYKTMKSQRNDGLISLIDLKLNQNFYNNIDPYRVAEKDIEGRNIQVPDVAVFLGFGLGYHIYEYLKKYPQARVLIFERDPEVLKTTFSNMLHKDILSSPNVYFIGCEDVRTSYPLIFQFLNIPANIYFLKSINIIELPSAFVAYKDYYLAAIRMLKEAIHQVLLLYGNDPYDSLLGIKYTLRNISTIIDNPGIKDLEGIFKGKPGIVIASGPSLNKNAHLLEGLREKAVMCAADGTVKILKHKGLPPAHFVTSLERVIETSYLFEGLTPEDVEGSYLAACPVIVPETYANFPGEKIIVYRNFATFEWLDIKKGILDIGPSAGNMAFKVLEFLGCDPIIMIGQDLALADDLTTHADGFHYGKNVINEAEKRSLFKVEGNCQPEVWTKAVYKQFLLHYERDVAAYKGKAINATEGGAKIHGTEIMTFQEAIDKYIKDDIKVSKTIKNKLKPTKDRVKQEQTKETLKKLYHAIEYCNGVIDKCNNGLKICNELETILKESNLDPQGEQLKIYNKNMQLLDDKSKEFSDRDFYLILMHYVQSFFIKSIMDLNGIKFNSQPCIQRDAALINKNKEFFSVLIGLTKKLLEEFDVSIKLMEDFKVEFEQRMEEKKKNKK